MILENKKKLTSYERVMIARDINRPNIREYIESLFENFIEMHGDRLYRDDPSLVGGIATFHDIPVTIIGHQKGHSTEENPRTEILTLRKNNHGSFSLAFLYIMYAKTQTAIVSIISIIINSPIVTAFK